jgi:hypothetical protein
MDVTVREREEGQVSYPAVQHDRKAYQRPALRVFEGLATVTGSEPS